MALASLQSSYQTHQPGVSLERVRNRVFARLLERGPKDDDELDFFIRAYLHKKVPRHAICAHHQSSFSFIADQFFERVTTVFGFANRNGGKTENTAILNVCDALFKGLEIVSAGAVIDQADKGYEYLTNMLAAEPLIARHVIGSIRSETLLDNGAKLELTTGTFAGLNSKHPVKVRIDEIELMHWMVLQEGFSMSISSPDGRWKAGDTLTSTRKFTNGTVQRLLDNKEGKRITVISWCIWETLQPCTRQCKGDPVYGDCPAYSRLNKDGEEELICGGKAHDLPPGGFYQIDDFIKKVSLLDKDTWEAQWLNLRPQGGALVYGEYFRDDPPYVVQPDEAEQLLKRAREEKWARVIAIDFGSNFHAGYYMQDPVSQIWYAYGEYWFSKDQDLPLATHAKNIKERDPLGWNARTAVFADPSGRQAIRDLEEHEIYATPANNDVYAGVNHVKRLFQRRQSDSLPGLRIFSTCVRLREELSVHYSHPLNKDGTVDKDKIVKKDDHSVDSCRYALLSFVTIGTGQYRMRKLRGVW